MNTNDHISYSENDEFSEYEDRFDRGGFQKIKCKHNKKVNKPKNKRGKRKRTHKDDFYDGIKSNVRS